ncbi:MAG TPA: hypothetical protein PLD88_06235 [Candidatus Berkiella sp.]|nr:hypothetical protein [Candidatus Berkiella sp.]
MIYINEEDNSIWEISEYNHMVTLINHAQMGVNFRENLALAIIESTIEENKRGYLSDIVLSDATLDHFQLEFGDFKKLYSQCPEPPVSTVQLEAVNELLAKTLEDLYEFIEDTFETEQIQQSIIPSLLKITSQSSAQDVEALYAELNKLKRIAEPSEATFIRSISYFITGLQGKDENRLVESTYSNKVKLNPEQISRMYSQFLKTKLVPSQLKEISSSSISTSNSSNTEKRKIESIDLIYSDEEDAAQSTKRPFLFQFAIAACADVTNFMKELFGNNSDEDEDEDEEKQRNSLRSNF